MYISDPEDLRSIVEGVWENKCCLDTSSTIVITTQKRWDEFSHVKCHKLVIPKGSKTFLRKRGVDISHIPKNDLDGVSLLADDYYLSDHDLPLLRVGSIFDAVQKLANYSMLHYKGVVASVTGSCGKSSTKSMLAHVLSNKGPVYAGSGNGNVPTVLLGQACDINEEYAAIFEVSSHALWKRPSASYSDYAVITNISESHMKDFKSLKNVAYAKSKIFTTFRRPENSIAIINADTECFNLLHAAACESASKVITYGKSCSADIRLQSYDSDGLVTASVFGNECSYMMNPLGEHNAINSLVVLAVVNDLGLPLTLLNMLKSYMPIVGRMSMEEIPLLDGTIKVVDDSYNANPASMTAAISYLDSIAVKNGGRKILVIGDMLELGSTSVSKHKEIASLIKSSSFDKVYLLGDNMARIWHLIPQKMRGASLTSYLHVTQLLKCELKVNDIVLFKSSNRMKLHKAVHEIKEFLKDNRV